MQLNIYLVVLTFLIIIVVIYLTDNITTAVMIIALLANFLFICVNLSSISAQILEPEIKPDDVGGGDSASESPDERTIYGEDYDKHNVYNTTYTTAYKEPQPVIGMSNSELTVSIDEANALMVQKRTRDKKCLDGAVSKNANYYKYNYDTEFILEEQKPWWGNGEK